MEISKTCFGKKIKKHKNPFSSEIYRVYIIFFLISIRFVFFNGRIIVILFRKQNKLKYLFTQR